MTEQNGQHDARVQVLTAEVRTLVVGSRQVTMSVYNQLDRVHYSEIEPFGRVNPKDAAGGWVYAVGRSRDSGTLVRSRALTWDMVRPPSFREIADADEKAWTDVAVAVLEPARLYAISGIARSKADDGMTSWQSRPAWRECSERCEAEIKRRGEQYEWMAEHGDWESLPLIVLAGLR